MTLVSGMESLGAGFSREGTAGLGLVGAPAPPWQRGFCFWPWAGRKHAQKGLRGRAPVAPRQALRARETAGEIGMQGAFFGKHAASTTGGRFLGLSRVSRSGCRVRGRRAALPGIGCAGRPSFPPTQAPLPGRGARQVQPASDTSSDPPRGRREGSLLFPWVGWVVVVFLLLLINVKTPSVSCSLRKPEHSLWARRRKG